MSRPFRFSISKKAVDRHDSTAFLVPSSGIWPRVRFYQQPWHLPFTAPSADGSDCFFCPFFGWQDSVWYDGPLVWRHQGMLVVLAAKGINVTIKLDPTAMTTLPAEVNSSGVQGRLDTEELWCSLIEAMSHRLGPATKEPRCYHVQLPELITNRWLCGLLAMLEATAPAEVLLPGATRSWFHNLDDNYKAGPPRSSLRARFKDWGVKIPPASMAGLDDRLIVDINAIVPYAPEEIFGMMITN